MLDLRVGVQRQIAKRAEIAVAARNRQVEIARQAAAGAAEIVGADIARASAMAVEVKRIRSGAKSCARLACGDVEQRPLGEQVDVGRTARRA